MQAYQSRLKRTTLETIYMSCIRPVMEYSNVVWENCIQTEQSSLENVQLDVDGVITVGIRGTSNHQLYLETGWETLQQRFIKKNVTLMYKIMQNEVPVYPYNRVADQINNTRSRQNITHFHLFTFARYKRAERLSQLYENGLYRHSNIYSLFIVMVKYINYLSQTIQNLQLRVLRTRNKINVRWIKIEANLSSITMGSDGHLEMYIFSG